LHAHPPEAGDDPWLEPTRAVLDETRSFCRGAQRLLLEEKLASQSGTCAKLGKVNTTVDLLREQLYGAKMNHGGLCRTLFDRLDKLLFQFLTSRHQGGISLTAKWLADHPAQ